MQKDPIPFSEEWKKNGCVVEIDTDGLIIDKEPDTDAINDFMMEAVKKTFGIDNSTLELELERFERGFIHKMKNYILLEKYKDGELNVIIHGAYFQSSRAPKVYDDAVKNIIDYAIWDKISDIDARNKSMDIRQRSIDDFVIRVRMSKNIKDYNVANTAEVLDSNNDFGFNPIASENIYSDPFSIRGSQMVSLAMNQAKITGTMPEKGDEIGYLITKNPITGRQTYEYFNQKDETLKHRINFNKYEEIISSLFESTQIAPLSQTRQEENWLEDMLNN